MGNKSAKGEQPQPLSEVWRAPDQQLQSVPEERARQEDLTEAWLQQNQLERLPPHVYRFELILMCSDKKSGREVRFPTVALNFGKAYHQEKGKKSKKKKKKKRKL